MAISIQEFVSAVEQEPYSLLAFALVGRVD
jgi:hypothetical protein